MNTKGDFGRAASPNYDEVRVFGRSVNVEFKRLWLRCCNSAFSFSARSLVPHAVAVYLKLEPIYPLKDAHVIPLRDIVVFSIPSAVACGVEEPAEYYSSLAPHQR